MKLTSVILICSMLTGCAWSHRHPVATKVIIVGVSVGVGVAVGLKTRGTTCKYDDGTRGTSCPYNDKDGK